MTFSSLRTIALGFALVLLGLACGDNPIDASSPGAVEDDPICVEACTHAESCGALDLIQATNVRTCILACNGHPSAVPECVADAPCAHLPLCVSLQVGCFAACNRLEACGALDAEGRDGCLWQCGRNESDPLVLECVANAPTCEDALACEVGACAPIVEGCLPTNCVEDGFEPNQDLASATPLGLDGLEGLSACRSEDLFVFDVDAGHSALVRVRFVHEEGDIDARLNEVWSTELVQVEDGRSFTDDEVLAAPKSEEDKVYVLQVFGYGGASNVYAIELERDPDREVCRIGDRCSFNTNCSEEKLCVDNPPCTEDVACRGGRCDIGDGLCYECLEDDDCGEGVCLAERRCASCAVDEDCGDGYRCVAEVCDLLACESDPSEPNDTQREAYTLAEGRFEGAALCGVDVDWYRIDVPPGGGELYIEANFEHVRGDLDMVAVGQDPQGEVLPLGVANSVRNDEHLLLDTRESEAIFLEVSANGAAQLPYALTLDFDPDETRCTRSGDCPPGLTCNPVGLCRPPTSCGRDHDCHFGRCHPEGLCRECLDDDDCPNAVCDEAGRCAACLRESDCPAPLSCVEAICQPAACANEPFEPNDTREQATPLAEGFIPNLAICPGDGDWFQIDAEPGEVLYIVLKFSHAQGDLDAVLYPPIGAALAEGRSITDNEYLLAEVERAGAQMLFVSAFGTGAAYGLELRRDPDLPLCRLDEDCGPDARCGETLTCLPRAHCLRNPDCGGDAPACNPATRLCQPCQPDELEPNDSAGDALPLDGDIVELNTCAGEDWFAISAEAGQVLEVVAEFDHSAGDLDLSLFDPNGAHLTSAISSDDDEHLMWTAEGGGRLLLRVAGFDGAFNHYRLRVGGE